MRNDEEKAAFNLRAKASMREFLRSKTWEEKVDSIARMNRMSKVAQAAMRETLAAERAAAEKAKNLPTQPGEETRTQTKADFLQE